MIFVTVGTHEQSFNRLVKAIDQLKIRGVITESVFIQTGYSTYIPLACEYKKFISMTQMSDYMKRADIIITHGGPSSFVMALQYGKVPIVVPRLSKYNEHVNDHQLTFCRELLKKKFPIVVIEQIDDLYSKIEVLSKQSNDGEIKLNNQDFVNSFKKITSSLIK